MKSCIVFIFSIVTVLVFGQNTTTDFQKEFDSFNKTINTEFDDFRKKNNEIFAESLKKQWEEFGVEKAKELPKKPKPTKQPEVPKDEPIHNKVPDEIVEPEDDEPIIDEKPIIDAKPQTTKPIIPDVPEQKKKEDSQNDGGEDEVISEENKKSNFSTIDIGFYETAISTYYDPSTLIKCEDASEEGVSAYWKKMSESNYTVIVSDIQKNSSTFNLNDWGIYMYVKDLSEKIHNSNNSQVAFQFFILNQLDLDAKVARVNNKLTLLINFKSIVYSISFLTIEGKRYYLMTKDNNASIYTFKSKLSDANKPFDLNIKSPPKVSNVLSYRDLNIKSIGKTVRIAYYQPVTLFYDEMPLTDLPIFFNSGLSIETTLSLQKELKPLIQNKTEVDAVQFLLSLVQQSFEYKTDGDQFGKEKYFFTEDILFYPYSDCEDRSIFFAHLVRTLLGLEVVGLNYPNHVATAVKFNSSISGDAVLINNTKYIICDPTYIGSDVGTAMPQFKNVSPSVIRVDR
jgi:hypothetical protein